MNFVARAAWKKVALTENQIKENKTKKKEKKNSRQIHHGLPPADDGQTRNGGRHRRRLGGVRRRFGAAVGRRGAAGRRRGLVGVHVERGQRVRARAASHLRRRRRAAVVPFCAPKKK